MGKIKKNFKYKKIKNFFNKEELDILKIYCEIKSRTSTENFNLEKNWGQGFYGDYLMESFLLKKKKFMQKQCGIDLLPTYSFWRLYTKFQNLPKHRDRPSCEISVTASIMNDGTDWPIYVDDNPILLKPGDACIYLGCDSLHWREEFKGDYNAQVFFHYVDKKGSNAEYYLDKRPFWGMDYTL